MKFVVSRNLISGAQLVEVHDKRGFVASIVGTPDGSLKIVSKYATGETTEAHGLPDRTVNDERVRAIIVTLGNEPQK
jgi:hypothetical protein